MMDRLTQWMGEHAAVVNNHTNYIDRLAAYEDTGLTPEEIENLQTIFRGMTGNEYIRLDEDLRNILKAKNEGRLLVLDEETALALAACVHGCNTNKRLAGASYMRNIRSDNPQSISYYRAIEILFEIADAALKEG